MICTSPTLRSRSETKSRYLTNDRYLIHAPYGGKEGRTGSWRALVEAQQAGKIRSLGVSNYGVHHLNELEAFIKELEAENGKGKAGAISVGQWELHPWLARPDIVEWCHSRGVVLEAYCPVVRGQRFDEPILQPMVKKYSKTPAQILIRWSLQKVIQTISAVSKLALTLLIGFRAIAKICDAFQNRGERGCL